jgi:hypothetical protein
MQEEVNNTALGMAINTALKTQTLSITFTQDDIHIYEKLKQKADADERSLNWMTKKILEEALCLNQQ